MQTLIYVAKILYHLLFTCLLFFGARLFDKEKITRPVLVNGKTVAQVSKYGNKLPKTFILIYCALEGAYAILCGQPGVYIYDRRFYAYRFMYGLFTKESSVGLYYVQTFLRNISHDPRLLFFTVGFLYLLLTLLAYNLSKDTIPYVLLLVGMSQYLLFGCYQLKQCMASAFVALSIICFLNQKRIFCVAFAVIAIVFHEVAWIIIPIYLILLGSKSKWLRILAYAFLLVSVFGFEQISRVTLKLVTTIIPGMSSQVSIYVDDSGAFSTDSNLMTILKGIPFYVISLFGIIYRKKLIDKIDNYDRYLFIGLFVSTAMLLSAYMYWMWRFAELFYFVVFIFAGQIWKYLKNDKRVFYDALVILPLAFFTYRKLFISYFNYGGLI